MARFCVLECQFCRKNTRLKKECRDAEATRFVEAAEEDGAYEVHDSAALTGVILSPEAAL